MSTAELVFEKTRSLPDELQQEALRFVDSLRAQGMELNDARTWSRFSAEQMASQYAPSDSVYDAD
jgi:hypothetical protein